MKKYCDCSKNLFTVTIRKGGRQGRRGKQGGREVGRGMEGAKGRMKESVAISVFFNGTNYDERR